MNDIVVTETDDYTAVESDILFVARLFLSDLQFMLSTSPHMSSSINIISIAKEKLTAMYIWKYRSF